MAQSPPVIDTNSSYLAKTFSTFTADIDLTGQSGFPNHVAQRLVLVNGTDGALVATLVDFAGKSYTLTVLANSTWEECHAVRTIAAATADTFTEIRAYWWTGSSLRNNP